MTKPTHFFLGLLSNLFNGAIAQPVDAQDALREKPLEPRSTQAPIPPATPTLGEASSNVCNTSLGFRYGAACNPRW